MFFENRSINLKIKCIAVLTSIIMVCLTQLTVVTTTSNNKVLEWLFVNVLI